MQWHHYNLWAWFPLAVFFFFNHILENNYMFWNRFNWQQYGGGEKMSDLVLRRTRNTVINIFVFLLLCLQKVNNLKLASSLTYLPWEIAISPTVRVIGFPSLSLQTLPQELLLFSQILFDEAILAHFLTNLNAERLMTIGWKSFGISSYTYQDYDKNTLVKGGSGGWKKKITLCHTAAV